MTTGTRVSSLEGYTYETLPQKYRFALKRAVCRVEILKWDSSYDMRYELFNRLNTGGTPLTQQEIILTSVPIIYAEWEGFFVSAFQLYLREINKLSLKINELSKHYLLRETECRYKQLKEYPKDLKKRQNFLQNLMTYFRQDDPMMLKMDVNTESNLGFGIMNGILCYFNLREIKEHVNDDAYSLKDDMDKFMLHIRNGISHGDPSITATTADITKAISLVERLMHIIEDVLCEGFENEVYKDKIL